MDGDPILYDWTRHLVAEARRDADPGLELAAEARVLKAEIERRADLIMRHPEWADAWGVEVSDLGVPGLRRFGRRSRPIPRFSATCVLAAVAERWIRPGWRWRIEASIGSPPFLMFTGFDPVEAGERGVE